MKNPVKFFAALFITLLTAALCVSMNAYAAENTLGTEQPYLYCVYYNSEDEEVDGNKLPAGDYTVDVMLEGMQSISVLQYTAEYDTSVVSALSTESVITDTYPELSLGGIKTTAPENGKSRVVLALASTADSSTALDQGNAVTVARMEVTVSTGDDVIDFEDYFDFVTDPDLTFTEADYTDGIEDAYVLDTTTETTYNTYLMTADVTPENELEPETITVSGKVLIASDAQGTASNFGLRGVKIYAYDNDNNVIAETVSNAEGEKTTWGNFTLEVPSGTTRFCVGHPTAKDTIVNRCFTIAGDANIENANVAVVMCDYNDDGGVNVIDNGSFSKIMKGDYNIYADFNNDGGVNVIDKGIFSKILKNGSRIDYLDSLYFE